MKLKHVQTTLVVLSLLVVGTQPVLGTKSIPSDTSIGTWDPVYGIYTLTTDVSETIQIDEHNLTLEGNGYTITGPGTGNGVSLSQKTGITIRNLTVKQFACGIYLWHSTDNTLTGNTTSGNVVGIKLSYSGNNTLTDNSSQPNECMGIHLYSSHGNTVSGNTTSNNLHPTWSHGIYLSYANHNTITGNIANANNSYGIHLHHECHDNLLSENITNGNMRGIALFRSTNNILTNNTVNSNSHQGISLGESNSNTLTGNTTANNLTGIHLGNSSDNTLTDNIANSNGHTGIAAQYSCKNKVADNTANENGHFGIYLSTDSSSNTVTNNTASGNNTYGVGIWASSDNEITNNRLSGNTTAISAGGPDHGGNRFLNNDLSNSSSWSLMISDDPQFELSDNDYSNSVNGIALGHMDGVSLSGIELSTLQGGTGLMLTGVTNSRFSGLIVSGCEYGIRIGATSTGNTFHDNTVSDSIWGMLIKYNSGGNIIYNNNFINNTNQACVDDTSGSIFHLDKPVGGNYWSDWTSPDADADGFVDHPKAFTGGQDNLPWADPDGWVCRDPREMIEELADQVMSLNLQHGIDNSLDAKLVAALQTLEDVNENNDKVAINTLEAFINAVEAQSDSKIPKANADALITKAQQIIYCLSGS